jgi:hypothetical protein
VIRFGGQDIVHNPANVLATITRSFGVPHGRAHLLPDE